MNNNKASPKQNLNNDALPWLISLSFYFLHSDNEEDRGRSSHNGQSGKEFRDEEETVTTKSVQIVQATETTATRKKGGIPSRKVDLGAAANYTGDGSPGTTTKQVAGSYFTYITIYYIFYKCSCACIRPWSLSKCPVLQPQPAAAAPQPSSTGLADLIMVDTALSQPAATGMISSNTLILDEMFLFVV